MTITAKTKTDTTPCDRDAIDEWGDQATGEVHEYVELMDLDGWGIDVGADEHADACRRMAAWLSEHEGDALSISVRSPRRGEAAGTYQITHCGDLQILGYSIPVPDLIRELVQAAWQHACDSWPTD